MSVYIDVELPAGPSPVVLTREVRLTVVVLSVLFTTRGNVTVGSKTATRVGTAVGGAEERKVEGVAAAVVVVSATVVVVVDVVEAAAAVAVVSATVVEAAAVVVEVVVVVVAVVVVIVGATVVVGIVTVVPGARARLKNNDEPERPAFTPPPTM